MEKEIRFLRLTRYSICSSTIHIGFSDGSSIETPKMFPHKANRIVTFWKKGLVDLVKKELGI